MTSSPAGPPWLFRAIAILSGIAVAALALAAGEVVARLADPPSPQEKMEADTRDYQAWAQGPCYRVEGDLLVRIPPSRDVAHPTVDPSAVFPLHKQPGVHRIVVVGESTGEMLERMMADLVADAKCGEKVEVLKCSVSGSHPWIAIRRAQQALAWSPDAIVVAIGHNFLLQDFPPPAPLRLDHSRLAQEIYHLLPPKEEPGAEKGVSLPNPPDVGRDAYGKLLDLARPHGVAVVAVVLASNLWWRPLPENGYVTSADRTAAWLKWAQGDVRGAAEVLAPAQGPDGALRAYERAEFHAQDGDWVAAKRDLEAARDLEAQSQRATTAVTKAIAETARAGGALVVDANALFTPLAAHGIPGWDIFLDNCHPRHGPLELLARNVLSAAVSGVDTICPARPPVPPEPATEYQTLAKSVDGLRVPDAQEILRWREPPGNPGLRRATDGPFTNLLRRAPDEARSVLDQFDKEVLSGTDPVVHSALLMSFSEAARDAQRLDLARWSIDKSLGVTPTAAAALDLGLLELRAHDVTAARTVLEQAVRQDSSNALAQGLLAAPPFH